MVCYAVVLHLGDVDKNREERYTRADPERSGSPVPALVASMTSDIRMDISTRLVSLNSHLTASASRSQKGTPTMAFNKERKRCSSANTNTIAYFRTAERSNNRAPHDPLVDWIRTKAG
mmetsp:Transcript_14009/g.38491  ORF Transcript_14009/g.38491 Transcript_14009/m.38491 type:complete len:118 (-) Transcript_14009:98-451(-)